MKPTEEQLAAAMRKVEQRFKVGQLDPEDYKRRLESRLKRYESRMKKAKDFNKNWDKELEFYVDEFEDWMEEIPAIWIKPLPFPHPVLMPDFDEDWRLFLAEQRNISGQSAAYLTNAAREEKKILRQIVVSRAWLWIALTEDVKVGSDEFWELVLDDVVRELPDWVVPCGDDLGTPDTKTLRNMISVRKHKRFLDRITGAKISRDG